MLDEINGACGQRQFPGTQGEESTQCENASSKQLRALIHDQDYKCALSGVELNPETANADHVQPVKFGGNNSIDNIVILHEKVNTMKGELAKDEFIEWCCLVADHVRGEGGNGSLEKI